MHSLEELAHALKDVSPEVRDIILEDVRFRRASENREFDFKKRGREREQLGLWVGLVLNAMAIVAILGVAIYGFALKNAGVSGAIGLALGGGLAKAIEGIQNVRNKPKE